MRVTGWRRPGWVAREVFAQEQGQPASAGVPGWGVAYGRDPETGAVWRWQPDLEER